MCHARIRGLPTPELKVPDSHYFSIFKKVSYTHFTELIRIDEQLKRLFYEQRYCNPTKE